MCFCREETGGRAAGGMAHQVGPDKGSVTPPQDLGLAQPQQGLPGALRSMMDSHACHPGEESEQDRSVNRTVLWQLCFGGWTWTLLMGAWPSWLAKDACQMHPSCRLLGCTLRDQPG